MFPPPWKDEARNNRRSGHVDCQADFQRQHRATKPTSSSSPSPLLLWSEQRQYPHHQQPANLRRTAVRDGKACAAAPAGAVGDNGRIRFEFRAVPHGGPLKVEPEGGGKGCYTVHAGGPQPRRAKGNGGSTTTKKRKRGLLSRRGPGNDRADGGGVPSGAAASEYSASMGSGTRASLQAEENQSGGLPDLGSTWRDKLLLQALRETGDEMKRRRQTHREVRARRAAEEEEAAGRGDGGVGSASSSHGSRRGSGCVAMTTMQAGGEGRWKPPLSRRTREYLTANPAEAVRIAVDPNNPYPDPVNSHALGSPAKPEREEREKRRAKDDTSTLRNRRRTRMAPSAHHGRSRAGTATSGGGVGASGALGCLRVPGRAVPATAGAFEGEPGGLLAGDAATGAGSGTSDGDETAAVAARRASPVVKTARRRSTTGDRHRVDSRVVDALEEEDCGGGMMESVSLTTSVEVTVLDGIPVGEERDRSSSNSSSSSSNDEFVDGGEQAACGTNGGASGRQRHAPTVSDRAELPPLKSQQPKGRTASSVGVAGPDGGQDANARRGAGGLDADSFPSAVASSVDNERDAAGLVGRRRSTVLELREALAAGKRVSNEGAEAEALAGAVPTGSGAEAAEAPKEGRGHQEPPPAPFRGTFWDDDDGEPTFPARRVSYNLHSGKRRGSGKTVGGDGDAASGTSATAIADAAPPAGSGAEETIRRPSTLQETSTSAGKGRAEEFAGLRELSDGGIGRKALSAHTKNEGNRRQFFQLYRRMARQAEIVGDTGVLSEEGHTPRQEFIRKMLAMGRMPVPILLRDPSALQDLNLAHRGLGDDVLCAAAEVLTRLPHINTLNVSDNRLTDRSLCKLCSLVVEMPGLKSLDLSCNKVDEAAAIIRGYLAHPSCSLQTLSLRSADVDDNECCFLMEAISRNQSLTKLDVSENKIGQNEMLNAVQPDVVTGGEGIAETLAGNAALRELNLSWNNLRQESAAAIGRALSLNRGLVSLNLAHNAFNDLPSQELGDSLRMNSTLQSLDMSYNGLTPAATIVIASACKANTSLARLTLSGNRLGRQGSAALLSAIRKRTTAGKGRKVSPLLLGLEGCDSESDSPNLFDVDEPSGEYKLDMSLPYSRMVASELVAISETKKGFEIEGIWSAKDMESLDSPERRELIRTNREASSSVSRLEAARPCARAIAEIAQKAAVAHATGGGSGGSGGGDDVAVTDIVLDGYERCRAKEQVMKLLQAVELKPSRGAMERALDEMDWANIAGDNDAFFAVFRAAFRVFDEDRSGSLELNELLELFQGLGCEMDEMRCRALISLYDLDRSGVLETEEFVTWMMLEHVRDPTCPKGKLMEISKARPWTVPRDGAYMISFRASRFPGDIIHVESVEGLAAMVENIRHMNTATERLRMFENAAMHTDMLLTAKQAEMMAILVEHDQDRVMTAERLLPQVVNSDERTQFLESFLNEHQRLRLAVRMKGLFRAIMGNPTGFYTLDLASVQGRMTAIKLGEIANAERCLATTRGASDTSQKGNRMMFRNEVMDTVPQDLTVDWFVKLPRRGVIRMDVVSTERPRLSVRALSDARFESFKALIGFDDEMKQIKEAYEILEQRRPSHKPGLRIWQRGTAATGNSTPIATGIGASHSKNGNSDTTTTTTTTTTTSNSNHTESVATATASAAGLSAGDSGDSKSKEGESGVAVGGGGRHLAAAASSAQLFLYHYDPLSIFRAKDHNCMVVVPDVEIPDCIIGSQVIEHWQQFHASSHFCLEYVEVAKRSAAAAPPGGGGSGANGSGSGANDPSTATAGDGVGGSEGGSGRGGLSSLGVSASAFGAGGVGAGHGGGDRVPVSGGGGGGPGAGVAPGPTRIYRWVYHRLVVLQTAAAAAWYTCRQAMEIASAFPWQDFGRVQALIIMFSRIVDMENFSEVVLSAVRGEEKRELEHRLGILNVLNPVRPDGPYLLDLKVWEEREWAKILIKLAVEEPGANWEHETYTHARGTPNIQGWLLPESWTRDDDDMGGDGGPRRSGILCLRYITDASLGCIAKWEVRKSLSSRTLGGIQRVL